MLSIVIVTYNSADVLGGLLDSLVPALAGIPEYRLMVADNASPDTSVAVALRHPLAPEVLQVGFNSGYSFAINAAMDTLDEAGPLLLLNPDIRLYPDSIAAMLKALDAPGVGAVAPRVLHEDGSLAFSIRREPSLLTAWSEAVLGGRLAGRMGIGEIIEMPECYRKGDVIACASGAILMVADRAKLLLGDWDERYFLYSEEVDYLRRLREAGLLLRYVPEAACVHIGGESNTNPRLYALLTANRIRYFRRYHGAVATSLFRLAIGTGAALRSAFGQTHRSAFQTAWLSDAKLAAIAPMLQGRSAAAE